MAVFLILKFGHIFEIEIRFDGRFPGTNSYYSCGVSCTRYSERFYDNDVIPRKTAICFPCVRKGGGRTFGAFYRLNAFRVYLRIIHSGRVPFRDLPKITARIIQRGQDPSLLRAHRAIGRLRDPRFTGIY